MSRRPSEVSQAVLAWALTDPGTVARYRQMIETVPGWTCAWFTGALSGRGHGRFWLASVEGRDVTIIAHRFAFALEHGLEELLATPVLGNRCDNPLCQLIAPRHVVRSSPGENRREWAARRRLAGGALANRRGARGRAREIRDAIRAGGDGLALVVAAGHCQDGVQLPLWTSPGLVEAQPEVTPG